MKNYIHVYDTDVVVFGAGPAGIAASIAAAIEGQDTYLIEASNKIGGVMSSCPGMMLGGGYPMGKSIGGFFEDFTQRMLNCKPPIAEKRKSRLENFGEEVFYDHEYAISILHDMLDEAGVNLVINSIACKTSLLDNVIVSVEVVDTQGVNLFKAKQYIDCTGDGDIANKAGVPSQVGNEEGLMMGATLTFFMENVDTDKVFQDDDQDPYFTGYASKGIAEGRIHWSIPQIYMVRGFRQGSVFFNTVTITSVDGRDSQSVLKGTKIGRDRALELVAFCKEEIPGFKESFVSCIGSIIGVRETRRLEGLHQLSYEEISKGMKFEDGVVACDNPLDEIFRNEETPHYSHYAALDVSYYTIPFRSLVPKRIKNLLFAGRNISADWQSFSSIRGMPQCMVMGQSVGIAAAIANKNSCSVQEIESKKVIDMLIELGVNGIGGKDL